MFGPTATRRTEQEHRIGGGFVEPSVDDADHERVAQALQLAVGRADRGPHDAVRRQHVQPREQGPQPERGALSRAGASAVWAVRLRSLPVLPRHPRSVDQGREVGSYQRRGVLFCPYRYSTVHSSRTIGPAARRASASRRTDSRVPLGTL